MKFGYCPRAGSLLRLISSVLLLALAVNGNLLAQTAGQNAIINVDTRIIGGQETGDNYPWMVALVYNDGRTLADRQFCAGTLINERWVLTAAHCIFTEAGSVLPTHALKVATGVYNLHLDTPDAEIVVSNIIVHPSYDHFALNPLNDIALLELANTSGLAPVVLSGQPIENLTGLQARVIGWGATDISNPANPLYPVRLNGVDIPIVSHAVCNAPQSYGGAIQDTQLCAGVAAGGKDSCFGDSGGPLFVTHNGVQQQVGIVSFGNGCAQPNYYGVYTNVPKFLAWVKSYSSVNSTSYTPTTNSSTNTPVHTASSTASSGWVLLLMLLGAWRLRSKQQ